MAPCTRVLTILLTLLSTVTTVAPVAACPPGARFCPSRGRSAYQPVRHQVDQPTYRHPVHQPIPHRDDRDYGSVQEPVARLVPPASHAHQSLPSPRTGEAGHATVKTSPPPEPKAVEPPSVERPASEALASAADEAPAAETGQIETSPAEEPAAADPLAEVREQFAAAKAAFAARNYGTALELMDKVVAALPGSNEALQFRSLIHFALADDAAASADAYAALKTGPVWNREMLATLYGDVGRYESQLRSLQVRAAGRPDSVEVHFLLAYQSLLNGDLAAGEIELRAILGINPDEPLAGRLLDAVRDQRQQQTVAER